MTPDLTLAEAAEILRVPRQSLQRLAAAGAIGHYRIGRHYRFTSQHIETFRADNNVEPVSFMGRSKAAKRSRSA